MSRPRTYSSTAYLWLTVIGTAGIAALFMPFAFDYSPVRAVFDKDLWRFALPFFLSLFISAASMRWMLFGPFSRPERAIAYAVGAAAAGVTLSLYADINWPGDAQEWAAVVSPVAILLWGVYVLMTNPRVRRSGSVAAIQVPYLANGALCLIGFFEGWQVGAYCVLATAIAYSLQIAVVLTIRDYRE